MSTCGVMVVRNEEDILEQTLRNLVSQVDEVIVRDNLSVDGTTDILHQLASEGIGVSFEADSEPGYYQSRKMSALAALAQEKGHEWVVPCDADEVWYCPHGAIGEFLARQPAHVLVVEAELYDHVATAEDPPGDPVRRMGWRRRFPVPLPKVACRLRTGLVIEQGNHGARYPRNPVGRAPGLVVRHFDKRTLEQFIGKVRTGARAYRAAPDLPEGMGQHWRDYDRLSDEQLGEVFRTWFWSANPGFDPELIFDPAPVRA